MSLSLINVDISDNLVLNKSDSEENGAETPEYRDRLRTWLIKKINSNTIPGLLWENDEKTVFRMPWKHAGRQDYSLEEDSKIFMAWAKHSGRYRAGVDKPEPIVWKTRLRCALNKMPDIRELPERSRLDISEPYRVYQFLPPVHKDSQIRRRTQRRRSQPSSPTPKIELPTHDQRPMLSLPYSNNGIFQDSPRFQAAKNPASIFQSPTSGDKPTPVAPWFRSFSYNGSDATVTDKIAPQHPFVDYLNARRAESQQNETNERMYPKEVFNFRNSAAGFAGALNPHHGSEFTPSALPNPNPMMMSAAGQGLAAFALRHQLGMTGSNPAALVSHLTAQVIALEHKFVEQTTQKSKLESENEKLKRDERNLQREIKRLQQIPKSIIDQIDNENSANLAKRFESLTNELDAINDALKQRGLFLDQNKNSSKRDSRVEDLEKTLSHYRQEHEKERMERESLEKDRERMQMTLQQMGDGLRSLAAVHISPADKKAIQMNFESLKQFDDKKNEIWNPIEDKRRSSCSPKRPRVSPPLDLSNIKRMRIESSEVKEETSSVTSQDEHVDIETPVSMPTAPPSFEGRPMTSPCSVSSCNSSVESATSPKSPQQHLLRMPFYQQHTNTIHVS